MPITRAYEQASQPGNFFVAGKNKIINGDMNINQRGFTSTTSSGNFGFDRWQAVFSGGTVTHSAQTFSTGAAPVAGYEGKNFTRIATASQSAAGHFTIFRQLIESVRTLAGQTVTISFWAKADSGTPKVAIEWAQNFGSGGSPSADVETYAGQVTLSTSWARYSVTLNSPSISGKTIGTNNEDKIFLHLWTSAGSTFNARTGSIGIQNSTIDFWGVQVEAGSVATPFTTATGTLAGELAACQRYFWRYAPSISTNTTFASGLAISTTRAIVPVRYPVVMRTTPSLTWSGTTGHFRVMFGAYGTADATSVALNSGGVQAFELDLYVASGLTTGNAVLAGTGSSSAYVDLSAEL